VLPDDDDVRTLVDGLPPYCDYCEHLVPAVWRGWRWYRYLGSGHAGLDAAAGSPSA
jgi:hypothetical protein